LDFPLSFLGSLFKQEKTYKEKYRINLFGTNFFDFPLSFLGSLFKQEK
jgi:hypothetical protein